MRYAQTYDKSNRGSILAATLVAIYCLATFNNNVISIGDLTFLHVSLLAGFVFLLNRAQLIGFIESKPYWMLYGMLLAGGILSLFRTDEFTISLLNTAGICISGILFFLLVPALRSERGKAAVVFVLLASIILQGSIILGTVSVHGDLARLKFVGKGMDKNFISLVLAMGGATSLSILLQLNKIIKPGRQIVRWFLTIFLLITTLCSAILIGLTYSRSGLICYLLCIIFICIFYSITSKSSRKTGVILLVIITFTLIFITPIFLSYNEFWYTNYDRLANAKVDDTMSGRRDLLAKGLTIIYDNPVIGVGPGASKAYSYKNTEGRVIHNSYVANWAEYGLFGLAAELYFLVFYLQTTRRAMTTEYNGFRRVLLSSAFPPYIFMRFFLDTLGILPFMFALLFALSLDDSQ